MAARRPDTYTLILLHVSPIVSKYDKRALLSFDLLFLEPSTIFIQISLHLFLIRFIMKSTDSLSMKQLPRNNIKRFFFCHINCILRQRRSCNLNFSKRNKWYSVEIIKQT